MDKLLTIITLSCLVWTASSLSCRVCQHAELPSGTRSELKRVWELTAKALGIWNPACRTTSFSDTTDCGLGANACMSASYVAKVESSGVTLDVEMYQRNCVEDSTVSDGECKDVTDFVDFIRAGQDASTSDALKELEGEACVCLGDDCNNEEQHIPVRGHAAFSGPVVHLLLLSLLIVLLFN